MKKIWLIVACVVLAGFLVVALMPDNKKTGMVQGDAYKFYYYPKLNAYYDFQDGQFVYTVDGGENWLKKKPKTTKLPETLSKKVMISGPIPDIWIYNEEHRKAHNGINTNYLSNENPSSRKTENAGNGVEAGVDLKDRTTVPGINEEQPVASSDNKVKVLNKPVQQLPEEEWEADLQIEAERLVNEGKKKLIKDVFETVDTL